MSDQQTWVEALNINSEKLAEWSAQAPAGKPILVHCIEQGLVDYGEYMRWAQARFGMAVLQPNFFQAAFDVGDLEKARMTGNWYPWCFPVATWEGVTFVACVEPPREPSEDARYVLADPRAMREAWGGTFTSIRAITPTPPKEEPGKPELGELSELPPLPQALDDSEMPDGLSTSPKAFVLDLDNATFNIGPVTEVKEIPPETAPEEPPPAPSVKEDSVSISVITPPQLKVVESEEPSVVTSSILPAKPAPAAPAEEGAVESEQEAVSAMFNSICERFQHAFIMKVTDQHARLYKYDAMLNPADPAKAVVNLSYPTFMRIVSKTNQPYHGYLVDSPAHQELFTALGYNTLPTSVTAIPVKFDNFLWGFVIAIGNEENQKMDSLTYMQECVEKLMNVTWAIWSKAA